MHTRSFALLRMTLLFDAFGPVLQNVADRITVDWQCKGKPDEREKEMGSEAF